FLLTNAAQLRPGFMVVLTGRAGLGKTTLLCKTALKSVQSEYSLFLTGRSGITERTSILDLLEARLRHHCPQSVAFEEGILNHLFERARRNHTRVLVFLDAINEHKDLDIMNASLAQFLTDVQGEPVILVCSCRDIYWSFFHSSDWPRH